MRVRDLVRSTIIRGAAATGLDRLTLTYQSLKNATHLGLVISTHETPSWQRDQLRRQLEWASKFYTIVGLSDFAKLWEHDAGTEKDPKPRLLFTFDDGRESNYTVAAPLLESMGARGVFFVVPAFAECSVERALEFYRARINPNSKPGDETWEDWKPMSPWQIADLAARGHAIGNHSFSHARMFGLDAEELEREVETSAAKLNAWTRKPVEAFAWTFAWDSIDRAAWSAIKKHHRFCFTPCPGQIDARIDSPHLIWRREIETKYSPAEFRFQYAGLADLAWSSRRRRLSDVLMTEN